MTKINIQKAVVTEILPKIYVKYMELIKYTWYIILVPHNNGNVKFIGVDGEHVRPQKLQTCMQE